MLYKPEYKAALFLLGYLEAVFWKFKKCNGNINKLYNATNSDASIGKMSEKQCHSLAY
jgi:hypothetical protein